MAGVGSSVERFVKSFAFSLLLGAIWATLSASRTRSLFARFSWIEFLWVFYNVAITVLFVIRSRPAVVSLNPLHWVVALLTSFSGFFFQRLESSNPGAELVSTALTGLGLALGIAAAINLGRSYDVFPALRGIRTGFLYGRVRHPMYTSSLIIRLGYVVANPSWYNAALFFALVWLYILRAGYEESILARNSDYLSYAQRVRCRFVPFVF